MHLVIFGSITVGQHVGGVGAVVADVADDVVDVADAAQYTLSNIPGEYDGAESERRWDVDVDVDVPFGGWDF
jgi:hypothetical protein